MQRQDSETPDADIDTQFSSPNADSELSPQNVSPSTGPWSKVLLSKAGKLKLSDDDPELRRSYRMKEQNKGFKGKSCADRKYIACESDPPIISPYIIKNLLQYRSYEVI